MGIFGAAHGLGEGGRRQKDPLPKIYHTYSTMMKLGSYTLPKEDPKKYESRDTFLSSADIRNF